MQTGLRVLVQVVVLAQRFSLQVCVCGYFPIDAAPPSYMQLFPGGKGVGSGERELEGRRRWRRRRHTLTRRPGGAEAEVGVIGSVMRVYRKMSKTTFCSESTAKLDCGLMGGAISLQEAIDSL